MHARDRGQVADGSRGGCRGSGSAAQGAGACRQRPGGGEAPAWDGGDAGAADVAAARRRSCSFATAQRLA